MPVSVSYLASDSPKWKKIILTRLNECHQIGVIKPVDAEEGWNTVAHSDKSCPVASSIFNRSSYDDP